MYTNSHRARGAVGNFNKMLIYAMPIESFGTRRSFTTPLITYERIRGKSW